MLEVCSAVPGLEPFPSQQPTGVRVAQPERRRARGASHAAPERRRRRRRSPTRRVREPPARRPASLIIFILRSLSSKFSYLRIILGFFLSGIIVTCNALMYLESILHYSIKCRSEMIL